MSASETRIEALLQRVREEPDSRAFVLLAEEYGQQERFDKALETLEAGLELQPNYVAARVALGRCQLQAGRAQESVMTLSKVVEADPSQMVAFKLLVRAHVENKDAENARSAFDRYNELNPQDPEIADLEKLVVGAEERLKTAEPSSQETASLVVEAPAFETKAAAIRSETIGPEGAALWDLSNLPRRPLRRPSSRRPPESGKSETSVEATVTLAELYLQQGHREEAADAFRQVLVADSSNEIARAELQKLDSEASVDPQPTSTTAPLPEEVRARVVARLEAYVERLSTLRESRDAPP